MPERYSLPEEGVHATAPTENRGPEFSSEAETQIVNFVYVQPAQEFRTLERVSNELDSLAEKVGVEAKAYEDEVGSMLSEAGDILDDIRFTVQSAFGRLVEKSVTKPKKSTEKKPGLLSRFFGKQEPQPPVEQEVPIQSFGSIWAKQRIERHGKQLDALLEQNPEFQNRLRSESDQNKKLALIRNFLSENGVFVIGHQDSADSSLLIGAEQHELDSRLHQAIDAVDYEAARRSLSSYITAPVSTNEKTTNSDNRGDSNDLVEL